MVSGLTDPGAGANLKLNRGAGCWIVRIGGEYDTARVSVPMSHGRWQPFPDIYVDVNFWCWLRLKGSKDSEGSPHPRLRRGLSCAWIILIILRPLLLAYG